MKPEDLEKHLRPDVYHMPKVSLVEVENTHNLEGGTCYTYEEMKAVSDFADKHKLLMHLDGARLFNASAATGTPVKKYCGLADTVTFCLSKGLGAPVGALLCGTDKFISDARRVRKMLGAGMRQAGILAAAGIYALKHNVERLHEDHENARRIAESLSQAEWAEIDTRKVETNIIFFKTRTNPADQVASQLKKKGVLCSTFDPETIRMVTHLGITASDTGEICAIIRGLKL